MCGRYVRRSDKQRIAESFAVHGPFEVTAYLPATVALTKRTTKSTITICVQGEIGQDGWLYIPRHC